MGGCDWLILTRFRLAFHRIHEVRNQTFLTFLAGWIHVHARRRSYVDTLMSHLLAPPPHCNLLKRFVKTRVSLESSVNPRIRLKACKSCWMR